MSIIDFMILVLVIFLLCICLVLHSISIRIKFERDEAIKQREKVLDELTRIAQENGEYD